MLSRVMKSRIETRSLTPRKSRPSSWRWRKPERKTAVSRRVLDGRVPVFAAAPPRTVGGEARQERFGIVPAAGLEAVEGGFIVALIQLRHGAGFVAWGHQFMQ